MARKTVKEKEKAFLSKRPNTPLEQTESTYVPSKSERDIALELLQKNGFNALIKDGVLYCECRNKGEYKRYVEFLKMKCNRNGEIPFSYGASVGNKPEEANEPILIMESM